MSLDYQKTTYRGTGGDTLKRTTYSKMNQWMDYIERPPPNPYEDAREGVFRSLTPVFTKTEKLEQKDSPPRPHTVRLPLPPPKPRPTRDVEIQTESMKSVASTEKKHSPRLDEKNAKTSPRISKLIERKHDKVFVTPRPLKNGDIDDCREMKILSVPVTVTGRHRDDKARIKTFNKPVHVNYYKSGGYDDFHKAFLKLQSMGITPSYPLFGPPKLRNGRMGGGWRHVQEVLQAGGNRIVFVDGGHRALDNLRLAEGRIPAGNILQPTLRSRTPRDKLQQLKMSAYDNYLTGVKGMERNNWTIVR